MVVLVYGLIIFSTVTQSAATKQFQRYGSPSAAFNAIKACSALALFALLSLWKPTFHWQTVLFGLGYGAALSLSMYSGYMALRSGPMALTSMLVSFSVLLPLLWGIVVGHESLNTWRYLAFVCLFLSMLLLHADQFKRPPDGAQKKSNGRWLFFVGVTFFCNGICSILQKAHQTRYLGNYNQEFMLFAMLLCAAIFLAASCKKGSVKALRTNGGAWCGVVAGLASGIANILTLRLAGLENATVLFPLVSVGTMLASLLCGRLIFKESLKLNHYAAMTVGSAAIVLLKL